MTYLSLQKLFIETLILYYYIIAHEEENIIYSHEYIKAIKSLSLNIIINVILLYILSGGTGLSLKSREGLEEVTLKTIQAMDRVRHIYIYEIRLRVLVKCQR